MAHPVQIFHATTVAVAGKAVLILGASGAGKSTLGLQLIGMGAQLVADDRTIVTRQDRALIASAPDAIHGMIEARGVGLLHTDPQDHVPLALVVDLDHLEGERLPQHHVFGLLGTTLPCLHKVDSPSFPAAILLYLRQQGTGI